MTGEPCAGLRISPRARNMAQKLGIDINSVSGSGPNGRIIARDIEAASFQTARQPAGPASGSPAQEFSDTPVGIASRWSERHAAYAAGLGTFSLSDGFISTRGIAHRCGSVITTLPLRPTQRRFGNHYSNCLHYHDGSCGVCIARCPVGAITRNGHDKARCRELVYGTAPERLSQQYGVPQTGCGLCQTRVPCEAAIPPACRIRN